MEAGQNAWLIKSDQLGKWVYVATPGPVANALRQKSIYLTEVGGSGTFSLATISATDRVRKIYAGVFNNFQSSTATASFGIAGDIAKYGVINLAITQADIWLDQFGLYLEAGVTENIIITLVVSGGATGAVELGIEYCDPT
jgi:hypothetical protein